MQSNSLIFEADNNIVQTKNIQDQSQCTDVTENQMILSTFKILNDKIQEESFPYCKQINNSRKVIKKILFEIKNIVTKYLNQQSIKNQFNVKITIKNNKRFVIEQLEDYQQEIEQEDLQIIFTEQYDKIYNKMNENIYVFYDEFIKDIQEVLYCILKNKKNVNKIYKEIIFLLDSNKEFYISQKKQDLDFLLKNWVKLKEKVNFFPSYPLNPRFFKEIYKFPSTLENSKLNKNNIYNIDNILKSGIQPNCNLESDKGCICCQQDIQIGQMSKSSIQEYTFKSTCEDITNKIECNNHCKCDQNCKNKQVQNLNTIEQKKQVKMKIVWGIDGYTRKNIGYLLPDIFDSKQKDAILNKIIKNLNHVGIEAWNITKVLDLLIQTILYNKSFNNLTFSEDQFLNKNELYKKQILNYEYQDSLQFIGISKENELLAYQILKKYSQIKQVRIGLQVHSKGLGGVCNTKKGIQKNTLIEQYQGEIYPIFYWYIKQSALKKFIQLLKKNKIKNCEDFKDGYLADFFNIQVEKDIKEPNGRSIFLVDPLYYGNFASRLSHSCNPNCWVIPIISNGKYSISMYAIKNIQQGEELTFDYCSSTESIEEHKKSICLCGDQICKFFYLASSQKHLEFRDKDISLLLLDNISESFLKFNALLLESSNQQLRKKQKNYLLKYNFGDDTFKQCPQWVRIWSSYILLEIEQENQDLIKQFQKKYNVIKQDIQFEIDNLKQQRVTDLIIAIDKINFICSQQKKQVESPLSFLIDKHYIKYLYKLILEIKQSKFIHNTRILKLIDLTLQNQICKKLKEQFKFLNEDNFIQYQIILQIKYIFLLISEYININHPQQIQVSDQFYFMAFTLRYFVTENYRNYSVDVDIRKCDLINPGNTLLYTNKEQQEQINDLNKVVDIMNMYFKKGIWQRLIMGVINILV